MATLYTFNGQQINLVEINNIHPVVTKLVNNKTNYYFPITLSGEEFVSEDYTSLTDATVARNTLIAATNSALSSSGGGGAFVDITGDPYDNTNLTTALNAKEDKTNKGIANGYASLDSGGKIPASELPSTVMEYKGSWNATTNTPTLADGVGTNGDVYLCTVAGTQDLGSGNIDFDVSDWVVYNSTIWQKSINSNLVVSVNSKQGAVVLNSDDIDDTETGLTNKWTTEAEKITWNGKQDALGFTPENSANKKTTLTDSDTDFSTTKAIRNAVKKFHGIESRTSISPLPTHITTTTFTLAANITAITYWYKGTSVTVNTAKTTTLSDGAGLYWIYFDGSTGNILASKTFPGITKDSNVFFASVLWNGSDLGLVMDERHNHTRNPDWHNWAHNTIGVRYGNGLLLSASGTGASATFTLESGKIYDEDIEFDVPASGDWATPNACRHLYLSGASTYSFDNTLSTVPFKIGGANRAIMVRGSDYAQDEVDASNRYINVFVYTTLDLLCPMYVFSETVSDDVYTDGGHTSVANARAIGFPDLVGFGLSPELKPIYRLIIRGTGELQTITTADDYRNVQSIPMGGGSSPISANGVTFTPAGDIESTNVQSAIEELDTEKQTRLSIRTESSTFTLSASDKDKYIRYTGAGNITVTVPDTLATNDVVTIRQAGDGVITLDNDTGVTLNGELKSAGIHSTLQIIKIDDGEYDVIGGVSY
jgi:hypothetical protein